MPVIRMRDPTDEAGARSWPRRLPSVPLRDARIGLLSIAKERSDEFLDALQAALGEHGLGCRRFAKSTHTKTADEAVLGAVVEHCDVVVAALAD